MFQELIDIKVDEQKGCPFVKKTIFLMNSYT